MSMYLVDLFFGNFVYCIWMIFFIFFFTFLGEGGVWLYHFNKSW